jgi:hypothetical protein
MQRMTKFLRNTAVIVFIAAAAEAPRGGIAAEFAFMTTTDYTTGSSSVIWLDGSYTSENDVASIHSDAVSRYYDGLVYVVNRLDGDNIQILDPDDGFSTIRQFSVGNGSGPHDIAFLTGTKAYVTRFETNDLWIVNPSTGAHTGTIDLSSFADSDGLCEMDQLFIKGDLLFVTIQRVDRNDWWLPVGDSYIAVVDCAADTLLDVDSVTPGKQSILLTGTNPFSNLQFDEYTNRLYVSCVGYWGMQDAGVEVINPYTLQSEGYLLSETAAGGDINDVEILSPTKGYAIVTNASFVTELISFDPSTGAKLATLYSPGDYVLNDIEISPDGELFLADQTETDPGVWIFDTAADTTIIAEPIDVGLPPFDITFSIPGFAEAETPAVTSLEQNYPNPFNPVTTIRFALAREGRVSLVVYDVAGRRIRTLVDRSLPAGAHSVEWDGLGDAGAEVQSGVYLYRLRTAAGTETKKAILLR